MNIKDTYRAIVVILLLIGGLNVSAQDNSIFEDDRLNYNRELHGGIFLHNFGWGLDLSQYFTQTVDKQRYFEIQFTFIHHPKQQKTFSYFIQDSRGYFYGKLNTFFVFRGLYGKKHIIAHKIRSSGVELAYKWGVGPSLGFLKPVYLEIFNPEFGGFLSIEKYDPEKHDLFNIFGRAGGLRGFDQIQFRPGFYAKFGLQIEYSGKKQGVTGIEAGIALDSYFQRIALMADIDNLQFFPMIYLNFFFGKKYNKM
jgi:hypothetical protein